MRRLILLFAAALAVSIAPAQPQLLNHGWRFVREAAPSEPAPVVVGAIPTVWEAVTLPHTPRLEPIPAPDQWQGTCRYARELKIAPAQKGERLWLRFDGAMTQSQVWINGRLAASHLGGYLPFTVDITDLLLPRTNTIEVWLDNRDNAVTGPKPLKRLDFNLYGGLYRNVWLIRKNAIHITDPIAADRVAGGGVFVRTDSVSDRQAVVCVKTHLRNMGAEDKQVQIVHTLSREGAPSIQFGGTQSIAHGQDTEVEYRIRIDSPALWSPENPTLYHLQTQLIADGVYLDSESTKIGIRDIEITPQGLLLNGQPRFLRGVNRHQEYPYVGYALSDRAQWRDARIIKQAGFDYVRCSHYPVAPAFLDACDHYGLLVLEPILGWQFFGDERFAEHALRSSRELIRRDRNHPSILAWELSINEIRMPEAFIDQAVRIGHEEYPGRCYVAGWMKYGYDIYIEARQHRKQALPAKPLIVSEYGDWEYFAMNAGFQQERWSDMLPEERSSRQARGAGEKRLLQQATNVQQAHNDNLSTHAFADGYWVMFDYSRGLHPDLELSGIMCPFRLPKYAYWFYRSQRDANEPSSFAEPVVRITSEWQPGVSQNVRVMSNCEQVELTLDGRSLGRHTPDRNDMSDRLRHAPFSFEAACNAPGTLLATGYIAGKAVATHRIQTPGPAAQIRLEVATQGIDAGRDDLLFVYATITDLVGNTVTGYTGQVSFRIAGDAACVYTDCPAAEAGIAPLLLRTGSKGGRIRISASAEGLRTAVTQRTIH